MSVGANSASFLNNSSYIVVFSITHCFAETEDGNRPALSVLAAFGFGFRSVFHNPVFAKRSVIKGHDATSERPEFGRKSDHEQFLMACVAAVIGFLSG